MADSKPFFRCPFTLELQPMGRVFANVALRDGKVARIEVLSQDHLLRTIEIFQKRGSDTISVVYGTKTLQPPTA